MNQQEFMVAVLGIALGGVTIVGSFWLAYQWIKLRRHAAPETHPAELGELRQQVALLQQSVDSVALEVERISEGQRFVTKVLSERAEPASLPGRSAPA